MVVNRKIFVIDASFMLASLLPDEQSPKSDDVVRKYLSREIELISSLIFKLEVINGLWAAKLTRRVKFEECLTLAERFLRFDISCKDVDSYATLKLAEETNLTVYDASYIWLAKSMNVSLLTKDRRMLRMA